MRRLRFSKAPDALAPCMDCRLAHMDDDPPPEKPEDAADAAPAFRKPFKRGNKSTMRSKTITEDPAQNDASEVVRPNKVAKPNPLNVSTKRDPASTSGAVQETLAHGSDRRIAQFDNKATSQTSRKPTASTTRRANTRRRRRCGRTAATSRRTAPRYIAARWPTANTRASRSRLTARC